MSKITITGSDAEEKLGKLVAELVKRGIVFKAYSTSDGYEIELTGGF